MRVLLINPPRTHEVIGNNPAVVEKERGYNPPLGLLYLAAFLLAHTEHEVHVLDAQVKELDAAGVEARIGSLTPDVIGITAMTLTLRDVVQTLQGARRAAPECRLVLGGPHAHLYPAESLRLPGVDLLILGEGERPFARWLDALDEPARWLDIPGLVFRRDGEMVETGPAAVEEDLDALPFPARRLTPYRRYSSLLSQGSVVTTMFTSRGCPFRCRFCDRPHLGKRFRARSAANVVDEMAACLALGIQDFLIYDDTFTVDRQRVLDVCQAIQERDLRLRFDIRARVDTVDPEVLGQLRAAGCAGIHYGVEAGTAKALEVLGKGITLAGAKEAFDETRRVGIPTLAYFMIGNPGETRADIEETFRVTRWLNPDYLHLTVLTPFPGTEIYADALRRGLLPRDVWRDFAADPSQPFQPPCWNEHLSREELNQLVVKGYKRFYLRPGYVFNRLRRIRSWSELTRKALAGLAVFRMSSPTSPGDAKPSPPGPA